MIELKEALSRFPDTVPPDMLAHIPALSCDPDAVRVVMIGEVVPQNSDDDFYGAGNPPAYLTTVLPLFEMAGLKVPSAHALLEHGIYLTNAVKRPKESPAIPMTVIAESLPALERELALFPNIEIVMLMGDVAKKAYNLLAKKRTKKAVIPSISTYKLRGQVFYDGKVRVVPSYIMTGGNLLIERSKLTMIAEDIQLMLNMRKGEYI